MDAEERLLGRRELLGLNTMPTYLSPSLRRRRRQPVFAVISSIDAKVLPGLAYLHTQRKYLLNPRNRGLVNRSLLEEVQQGKFADPLRRSTFCSTLRRSGH
eukprot:TRINITY_DN113685_c0_g1_i1.p1 TRINITY_DN113685_c0_g1~~TRINITY_DN113685_c0_g1_i1.p1  ORF type:complete len:101 (+),score=4.85 TRINITY_DN113685_c0_g1_i1:150-452(+)